MQLFDLKVKVTVGGRTLQEYDVRYDEKKRKASCFIASEEGKNFEVSITSHRQDYAISFQLFADGMSCESVGVRPGHTKTISALYTSATTARPLLFSSIKLTDDDNAVTVPPGRNPDDLGTLRCIIHRVEYLHEGKYMPRNFDLERATEVFHERTKKAGMHRVSFGDPVIAVEMRSVDMKDIDISPFATFTFRYRSQGMLQAQGIIPLNPRPAGTSSKRPGPEAAGPSKRPRTNINPEDIHRSVKVEDVETLDALLAERAAVEAQRAALDAKIREAEARRVKREPSPISLGLSKGEVIDLTLE